ncbi:MAG: 50S ribosomal protein L4 [Candidatus Babeliales bacterium]|jgi:large subunit ribosomal protein L4
MIAIPTYNKNGKTPDTVQLAAKLDRKDVSPATFACAIRSLFQNWRQGTVSCKTRGELAFSNKKPWRQKGTGRARVSSIRSPLWRKGGVIFGPQPRVRSIEINTKQKRLVFNNLFFGMLDKGAVQCLDLEMPTGKPSTQEAHKALAAMGLSGKKLVLFLPFGDEATYASFRNIPHVHIVLFDQPNAVQLSDARCWIFLKKDTDLFNTMVAQWN